MIFHRARIKHMPGVADSIIIDNTILAKTSSLKFIIIHTLCTYGILLHIIIKENTQTIGEVIVSVHYKF